VSDTCCQSAVHEVEQLGPVVRNNELRGVMADFGRELTFGYFLIPNADEPLLQTAERVEQLGLDYVAVQDHPYQRRFVDTWTLLSMIVARTSRIGVFPDVTSLPLRPPGVLAKAAASLDVLSGGRFELGLGAGAFWEAIEAYGGPRRTPGEALQALAEAIEVIRKVWSGERNLRFEGQHYRLKGAHSGPVPAHPIGIWLGAYGPRALQLTARSADGWVPSFQGDWQAIAAMVRRLDDAAAEAGREPRAIRRILNVGGTITDGTSEGPFRGPPSQWVDELTRAAVEYGFDTFVLWAEGEQQLERFADQVMPAARDQVATART
jgi:alkanesulfonate monooxygenase SsuD/methylene tetrahydromethanopterin reductase-like flavin-dependent oxidoreductase (luciferase family)